MAKVDLEQVLGAVAELEERTLETANKRETHTLPAAQQHLTAQASGIRVARETLKRKFALAEYQDELPGGNDDGAA